MWTFLGANQVFFFFLNRLCLKKRQSNKQGMMDSNVEESQGLDASQPFLGESEPKAKWQQTQVSICE